RFSSGTRPKRASSPPNRRAMQTKGLIGFTALALAALAMLIGLGVWQVEALHRKEGLIAAIDARAKGEPISLDQVIALAKEGRDPSYYRVRVEGRFDNTKERYLFSQSISDGTPGWRAIPAVNDSP